MCIHIPGHSYVFKHVHRYCYTCTHACCSCTGTAVCRSVYAYTCAVDSRYAHTFRIAAVAAACTWLAAA
eukprot:5642048-Lingulodinium_polyedra.AAC.1